MHRLAPGLVAIFLTVTGCSLGSDEPGLPKRILRNAPRHCPIALPQGPSVPAKELPDAMRGHLPHWLPHGFGVTDIFASDDGSYAGATWSDHRCRQVQVGVNFSSSVFGIRSGHRVGAWTLTKDVPRGCGNAVLGKARCLIYLARLRPAGSAGVETIGLNRKEANRIVLSIPLGERFL
jgi:hypothetical protein